MAGDKRARTALTIRILGRDYSVACPDDEREALLDSAEHLSKRMNAIKRRSKTVGTERIAIMAALNISRELLALQRETTQKAAELGHDGEAISERLDQLQLRIDSVLDDSR